MTSSMFSVAFWKDTLERSIKTAAQGVLLGLSIGEGFNVFNVDPMLALGFAGGGALLSLLTSIASAPFGPVGNASIINLEKPQDQ